MTTAQKPRARLFLEGCDKPDPDRVLDEIRRVLRQLDCHSGRAPKRSTRRDALLADRFGVCVTQDRPRKGPPVLTLHAITRDGPAPPGALVELILTRCCLALLDWLPVTYVALGDSGPRQSAAGFLADHGNDPDPAAKAPDTAPEADPDAAASDGSPAARLLRATLSHIGATVGVRPAPSHRLRMTAGWLIAGLVAVISLPLWGFLTVMALLRGMDLRLASRILALTVVLALLQDSDPLKAMLLGLIH